MTVSLRAGEDRNGVDCFVRAEAGWTVSGAVTTADGTPPPVVKLRLVPSGANSIHAWNNFDPARGHGRPARGEDFGFDPVLDLSDFAISPGNGRFTFVGVPSGQYTLLVLDFPGRTPPAPPSIEIGRMIAIGTDGLHGQLMATRRQFPPNRSTYYAQQDVQVVDRDVTMDVVLRSAARISGKIVFGEGVAPPANEAFRTVDILQESADGREWGALPSFVGPDWTFTTYGAPDGHYFLNVTGDLPGWYLQSITHGGEDLTETPLPIGTADVTGVVATFTHRPQQASIAGRVLRSMGRPDDTAVVIAFPSDRRKWANDVPLSRFVRSSATGPQGEYLIDGLRPGDYWLAATSAADAAASLRDASAFYAKLATQAAAVHLGTGQAFRELTTTVTTGGR
jgi:hypothetical protein